MVRLIDQFKNLKNYTIWASGCENMILEPEDTEPRFHP